MIILAGTNDLACNSTDFNPTHAAENIISMHRYVHSFGRPDAPVFTILGTIPCEHISTSLLLTPFTLLPSFSVAHVKTCNVPINEKLRQFASSCSSLVGLVDLERLMNHSNPILWKMDRVHPSQVGSDLMGRLFYEEMLSFSLKVWNWNRARLGLPIEDSRNKSRTNFNLECVPIG